MQLIDIPQLVTQVIGFVIVLLNFVPIGYFLTRSHNF